jgi:hypothetical protein
LQEILAEGGERKMDPMNTAGAKYHRSHLCLMSGRPIAAPVVSFTFGNDRNDERPDV